MKGRGRGVAWEVFLFRNVRNLKCGDQTSWQGWSRGAWRRRDFPCCSVVVAPLQGRNEHGLGSELPKNKVP